MRTRCPARRPSLPFRAVRSGGSGSKQDVRPLLGVSVKPRAHRTSRGPCGRLTPQKGRRQGRPGAGEAMKTGLDPGAPRPGLSDCPRAWGDVRGESTQGAIGMSGPRPPCVRELRLRLVDSRVPAGLVTDPQSPPATCGFANVRPAGWWTGGVALGPTAQVQTEASLPPLGHQPLVTSRQQVDRERSYWKPFQRNREATPRGGARGFHRPHDTAPPRGRCTVRPPGRPVPLCSRLRKERGRFRTPGRPEQRCAPGVLGPSVRPEVSPCSHAAVAHDDRGIDTRPRGARPSRSPSGSRLQRSSLREAPRERGGPSASGGPVRAGQEQVQGGSLRTKQETPVSLCRSWRAGCQEGG